MNPWGGMAMVLLALGGLMAAARAGQHYLAFPPEPARKTVHIGMGLICCGFPAIFTAIWPVAVLAILAVGGLLMMRFHPYLKREVGGVLGSVERASWGEIYFPVSVALVFWWSNGDAILFIVPILILTLADGFGALAGLRYGQVRYITDEGYKSAEGSLVFFVIAFMSAHVPVLLFSDVGRVESLLIALTLGFLVMLAEAASWEGLDNLFIPLLGFLLLDIYMGLSAGELLLRFLVATFLTALVLFWRHRTTLSHSAAIGSAFFGYIIWALGGWDWLVAPLILFLLYAWAVPLRGDKDVARDIHAVIRVMSGPMIYLVLNLRFQEPAYLFPFYLCFACHLVNICVSRLYDPDERALKVLGISTVISWGVIMIPLAIIHSERRIVIQSMLAVVAVWACGYVFWKTIRYSKTDCSAWMVWLREGFLAPGMAALAAVILNSII